MGVRILTKVDEVCYLGSFFDKGGGVDANVAVRINKTAPIFVMLRNVWMSRSTNLSTKLNCASMTQMSSQFCYLAREHGSKITKQNTIFKTFENKSSRNAIQVVRSHLQ